LVLRRSPRSAHHQFVFISRLLETFNGFLEHSNIRLPRTLDRFLRLTLVTPDMHRIHHSKTGGHSLTNFGTMFPWWDRLFGTYRDQPAAGLDAMAFGVDGFEERRHQMLPWMLAHPFLNEANEPSRLALHQRSLLPARRPDNPGHRRGGVCAILRSYQSVRRADACA
jgi:sterol desaturase/sphingolipid hydroxylase (fatty acid hydroxylase superfamily)